MAATVKIGEWSPPMMTPMRMAVQTAPDIAPFRYILSIRRRRS